MTATSALLWRKEVRELLPWWVGTGITMVSCWALMRPDSMPADWLFRWALDVERETFLAIGLCAYAAGAVTLGALSLGQEYAHQTLPGLLTHPVPRGRVLLVKLAVLATMLAALGGLAFVAWGSDPALVGRPADLRMLLPGVLPLAASLFLAPWLTMVARGALGGAVFTAVLPAFLWVTGASFRMPLPLLVTASVALGALGAAMTWRTFMRLEVTGGRDAEMDLTAWFSWSTLVVRAGRRQSRVAVLVRKELQLQQATFVVAGLYVAVWLTVVIGRRLGIGVLTNTPMFVATFLNTLLVPVLAGALPSAEERRLGVTDWQNLLPMAAWKQWVLKASVAVGTAIVLAVFLPMSLGTAADAETGWRNGMEPATVVMLCIAALYVSSLSPTGLRGLLTTMPVVAVAAIFAVQILLPFAELAQPAVRWLVQALPIVRIDDFAYAWWKLHRLEWTAGGLALLLLWFGHTNHRSADRSPARIARQFGWISAYIVAAAVVVSLVSQLFVHWIRTAATQ